MNRLPISFLQKLIESNNREWFNENKMLYEDARKIIVVFVESLIEEISLFDKAVLGLEAKNTIFRIYRDVRFSKDKTPYKTAFGSYIAPGGRKSAKAGYYLHIEPGNSFLAGGMHSPPKEQLAKVRQEIFYNSTEFKAIIGTKEFKQNFETVKGEKLKRPPKGFPADFAEIELLKHKDFIVINKLTDAFVLSEDFLENSVKLFKEMKSFNDFLNRAID